MVPLGTPWLGQDFVINFSAAEKLIWGKHLNMVPLGAEPWQESIPQFPSGCGWGFEGGSVLGEAVGHPCFVIVCTGINIAAVCYLEPWLWMGFWG